MSNEKHESEVWKPHNLTFYLSVYYSDKPDWNLQLLKLQKKGKTRDQNRRHLAFTILAPYISKVRETDPVEALLFACFKFDAFNDLDWASKLEDIFDRDQIIKDQRKDFMSIGSIAPVEYHSRSRQALKWIYEEASQDSSISVGNKEEVLNRLKSVVMIYGPSAVCSLFQRPELKSSFFMKTPNWRTGYFIEQALYEHFSHEQLLKMKHRDIQSAPDELIKFFGPVAEKSSS